MAMFAWISSPENVPRSTLHSEEIPTEANGWAGQNSTGYKNPEMDELIDAIEIELDREKRRAMWHRLQQIYAEDLPAIPLYPGQSRVWPLWLEGVTPTGHLNEHALGGALAHRGQLIRIAPAMVRYFTHRLTEAAIVLLLMSFCIYGLLGLMPGDPIDLMLSGDPNITSQDIARLKAVYGLDRPLLERYGHWLADALRRVRLFPIARQADARGPAAPLGNTCLLMGISLALAFALALPAGIVAALKPRSWYDYALNLFAFAGISVPSFWLALLLILLFAVELGWLPAGGVRSVGVDRFGDRWRTWCCRC